MDMEEFGQKLKSIFNKGAKASKDAFEKAGDKVQEFSDKSVVRLEKNKLESKLEDKYKEIGKMVAAQFEKGIEVSLGETPETDALKNLQSEVDLLKKQIAEKEDLLRKN